MSPDLIFWFPPTPIRTPPLDDWVTIRRVHYPSSTVRVEMTNPGPFAHGLFPAILKDLPPTLAPLQYVTHRKGYVASFANEFIVQWIQRRWEGTPALLRRHRMNFLAGEGYEYVLKGWQMTAGSPYYRVTLSIHPNPTDRALIIQAAPNVDAGYAEAVTDGLLTTAPLLVGMNSPAQFAYLRICLHDLQMLERPPSRITSPFQRSHESDLANRLRLLATLSCTALRMLLRQVETALIVPKNSALPSPNLVPADMMIKTVYPPAAQIAPPAVAVPMPRRPLGRPVECRRLTKPIIVQVIIRRIEIYANATFQFTPLPEGDPHANEIICESTLSPGQMLGTLPNELCLGVWDRAADPLDDGIPLMGVRATLLEASESRADRGDGGFRIAGAAALKAAVEYGSTRLQMLSPH